MMRTAVDERRWKEVWDLYRRHAPALHRVAAATCSTDPRLGPDEARDLVHSFVVDRLARVVAASRALPEEHRQRYLLAAFRNFLRSAARSHHRHAIALDRLAREFPAGSAEEHAPEPAVDASAVDRALADVRPELVAAVRLFFGLDGRPHSIRQIAAALQTTRYLARLAVIDGLVAIAARLEARGMLSDRELQAARAVLLEGREMEEAAQAIGLTRQQVRRALDRARAAVDARIQR